MLKDQLISELEKLLQKAMENFWHHQSPHGDEPETCQHCRVVKELKQIIHTLKLKE